MLSRLLGRNFKIAGAFLASGALAAVFIYVTASHASAQQQHPAAGSHFTQPEPIDFSNHEGWTQIFNGKNLDGWDGSPDVWHVEDGAIVGESSSEHPSGTTNIIWRGGEPANFELKAEMKLEGPGANGGIQYRSSNVPPSPLRIPASRLAQMTNEQRQQSQQREALAKKYAKWNIRGYQADFDYANRYTGQLYEQGTPRGIIAWRGQMVETDPGKKPRLLAVLGSSDDLKSFIKPGEWNQVEVVADGSTLIHIVNGHVMAILVDTDPAFSQRKGLIAFEIEGGGMVKISHRDVWLKKIALDQAQFGTWFHCVPLIFPSSETSVPASIFKNRRAVTIENEDLRLTVLREGGHIAEIFDKQTGVNPLWIPPWPSIEPSRHEPSEHPEFGSGSGAKLLAGIMGHNLCLDIFGDPSPEEAAAGVTVHGESSVVPYGISETDGQLLLRAHLPLAQLHFERQIELRGRRLRIREAVENLTACDRPIAWTQHVTLGPPFLDNQTNQLRASATRSMVYENDFGADMYLQKGAQFDWPAASRADGGTSDLRVMNPGPASSAYTSQLMDPRAEHAFFVAFSPAFHMAFGYIWKRVDFPWLGIWEENHSRKSSPWNGRTLARGMEFGLSPFPEPRRKMVERE